MRVVWTHNFDPADASRGTFMYTAAEGVRARGVDLRLEYLGNLRSPSGLWRARARAGQLTATADLIHAQYGSACALATAGAHGIPKVLSLRGSDWNVQRSFTAFQNVHTRLARTMTGLVIDQFDWVVTVSRRIALEVTSSLPGCNVSVLPSPIDLDRFTPRDKADARALLRRPNCGKKWVLFNTVKLDDPIKRFRLAKAACAIANCRRGDIELRIANDIPYGVVPIFVAACDLILCTSESEGWPNSVKEALACNVPFVSTDVSDLRDIAQQDRTCRICPPEAHAIADAICESLAMTGPRDLRRFVTDMSLDATSRHLVQIYESLVSVPSPRVTARTPDPKPL